jgi:tetratricopeptide (TPR) repeat protein
MIQEAFSLVADGIFMLRHRLLFFAVLCVPLRLPAGEADPELARGIFENVKPMMEAGKDAEAIPFLEKALAYDPGFTPAMLAMARIHEKAKRIPEAIVWYEKARDALAARKDPGAQDQADLQEAQARLTALVGVLGGIEGLKRKYAEEFRKRALEAEKAGLPYGALRATEEVLRLAPEDKAALEAQARLQERVGPVLAAAAAGGEWEELYNGKDLSGWQAYNGPWEAAQRGLQMKRGGEFYIFHVGPPRRNFLFQATIFHKTWRSNCYLMGRAQPNGSFYALSLRLNRWGKKGDTHEERVFEIMRFENWENAKTLVSQPSPPGDIGPGREIAVEFECRGAVLVGRLNGQEVLRCEDATLAEGGLGIMGAPNWYDDVEPLLEVSRIRVLNLP